MCYHRPAVPSIPASVRDAFEAYVAGPSRLRQALDGVDQVALNQRPVGSDWSIRDVIIHLSDAELVRGERIRRVIAEEQPELRPFDQDQWKRRLAYLWRDVELALSLVELLCHTNAELVRQLDAAGWERWGLYPEQGRVTVGDLIRMGAEHFEEHFRQVETIRRMFRAGAQA